MYTYMKPRILFILKRREDYDPEQHSANGMETGLFNSASFVNHMIFAEDVPTKMQVVIDNNCIDRAVTEFKPTHVIIEAIWVVPSKFAVLTKLHPNVKWIIRLHSEAPFLAQEGMAYDWIGDYVSYENLYIAANAPRMLNEMKMYLSLAHGWDYKEANRRVLYLPNYYPQFFFPPKLKNDSDQLHIGCFGAIRPLKNHVNQALAAIKFAESIGRKLRFHVNGRVELKSDAIVNTLKSIFQHLADRGHQLIFDTWVPRKEFLERCQTMDIGMQVSYSETFNIVGADLMSQGIPTIGSDEIPWMDEIAYANPNTAEDIYQALCKAWDNIDLNVHRNQQKMIFYGNETKRVWLETFQNLI